MENLVVYETLRSDADRFDRDFADFVISRRREDWKVKSCTFFRDEGKNAKWAFCAFEY